jgi:hypothetical protein
VILETIQFTRIKIFGERNTGTNFLSEAIEKNFKVDLLKPTDAVSVKTAGYNNFKNAQLYTNTNKSLKIKKSNVLGRKKVIQSLIKSFATNKLLDSMRVDNANIDFGWKHGCLNLEKLGEIPRFGETLFVALIRNPWKFCESLFRKPYNIIPGRIAAPNFSDFIRTPILLNTRDNAPPGQLIISNPIELWNIKVSSYFQSWELSRGQVSIFFYEEILLNPQVLKDRLQSFGITSISEDILLPELDVKNKNTHRTLTDFVSLAKSYDPLNSMTVDDAKFIHSALSNKLIMRTPYLDLYNSLASSVES